MGNVLLVQPDPLLGEAWKRVLAQEGMDVLEVPSVLEGIDRAREGGIDVIVVDAYDSGGPVAQLAAELRRLPDAPPVVLVSSSPRAPELSVHIGAADFVPKPCDPEDVLAAVRRITRVTVRILRHVEDDLNEQDRER